VFLTGINGMAGCSARHSYNGPPSASATVVIKPCEPMQLLPEIEAFLLCPTPDTWIAQALQNQDVMLIDHANCEQKAAMQLRNAGGGRAA
jgi:hypothetical protein